MEWKPIKSYKEMRKIYDEEIVKLIPNYDEYMSDFIRRYFLSYIGEREVYSELTQLYSEYGFIADEDDYYKYHLNNITKNFDISGNILEIAAGSVPTLSNLIARSQLNIGSGTITVYDPRLIISEPKYSNMKLYKEEFKKDIDISNFDLVISIMPCSATEIVLDSVFYGMKDFYISFCGCNHDPQPIYYMDYSYYDSTSSYPRFVESAKELCDASGLGELVVENLPEKFEVGYPLIYNKKSKGRF